MSIERLLRERGGVARSGDLAACGVSSTQLATALRRERVRKVAFGTVALQGASPARIAASTMRGQVGCVSACEEWGLPLWTTPKLPHIVVPRSRSWSRRDTVELASMSAHRSDLFVPGVLVPSVLTAIDQAARCTSWLEQLVIVEGALARGLVELPDLSSLTAGTVARRAWISRIVSRLSESPLETVARAVAVVAGFTVRQQVRIDGVGRVDAVIDEAVVLECDGWEYHSSRAAFEDDRARDRALVAQGLRVLRYTSATLRAEPERVVHELAAVTGRALDPRWAKRWALATAMPRRRSS